MASSLDQHRGRHAEGAADRFEVLKGLGGGIGVISELGHAQLRQPGLWFVGIAGVDIDRHHFEAGTAEALFEGVERRHLLAAGHAPGGPQVEQHGPPAPMLKGERLALVVLEDESGQPERAFGHVDGGHLATRKRGHFLGQFDRRAASHITARIASQGRNPVYPGQTNG